MQICLSPEPRRAHPDTLHTVIWDTTGLACLGKLFGDLEHVAMGQTRGLESMKHATEMCPELLLVLRTPGTGLIA